MAETTWRASKIAPEQERIQIIERVTRERADTTHYVSFRSGYLEAPVVTLDNDLLVYRAENGRLYSEFVALGEARAQQDDPVQQQILHDLLIEKAQDPSGPIFRELKQHAQQTEPLLIAANGIVVNGNRRLASMRELRADSPDTFRQFDQISVAVLPADLDDDDIEFIEASLQMAPDLKLDYSWINRRLKLRDHVERRGGGGDAIIAAYRFENDAEIDRELAELALAEEYLRYIGEPGNYDCVIELEDAFVAMMRELDGFSNRRVIELWSRAGFAMIKERERLKRPYNQYFPFVRPVPFEIVHWTMRTLAEDLDLAEPQKAGENRPVDPDLSKRLFTVLRDETRSMDMASRIMALSDRLRANEEHEIGASQAVKHLRQAKESLQHLDLETVSAVQAREIRAELIALEDYKPAFSPMADNQGQPDQKSGSFIGRVLGKN